MEYQTRRPNRLKEYDYSTPGYYFVTICVKEHKHILGRVVRCPEPHTGPSTHSAPSVGHDDLGVPQVELTRYGKVVGKYIESINHAYANVFVDKYVIMPNHVHLIIQITLKDGGCPPESGAPRSSRPTQMLPRVMGAFKRFTNLEAGFPIWQTSYHDHVIRNDADYRRIWDYIDTNPLKWWEDCYYTPGDGA